jgi:hypothetical protein
VKIGGTGFYRVDSIPTLVAAHQTGGKPESSWSSPDSTEARMKLGGRFGLCDLCDRRGIPGLRVLRRSSRKRRQFAVFMRAGLDAAVQGRCDRRGDEASAEESAWFRQKLEELDELHAAFGEAA